MKSLLTLLSVVCLCGCSAVVLREPLPETILTQKEQKQLEGTWLIDKDVVYLKFTDSGSPRLVSVEWKDGAFKMIEHQLTFAKAGDALYVSLETGEENGTNAYFFAEIKAEDDQCLVWAPKPEAFGDLIQDDILSGRIKKETDSVQVTIDTPAAAVLELISTNSAVINYKSPLVLRKMK